VRVLVAFAVRLAAGFLAVAVALVRLVAAFFGAAAFLVAVAALVLRPAVLALRVAELRRVVLIAMACARGGLLSLSDICWIS
ncbi:hypothetical protein, partial [Teichococcus oryzae]|uniref:hypothetical protein n=1 Tax=Teichococcus oryzae TaxID=1608942 RepID=UPI0013759B5F